MSTSDKLVMQCGQCDLPIMAEAFYCSDCGNQFRCKNCGEILQPGANNCMACGTPVTAKQAPNLVNTFKLRENKEERIYEIQFTNEVGKEIKEVIADLLKNKNTLINNMADTSYTTSKLTSISEKENLAQIAELTSNSGQAELPNQQSSTQVASINDYPHINDLEIKLNCKENEWLLLFAFYFSNYGVNTFTKDVVWQVYKDKRKTETRFKNLGTNWKTLFKKYIATVKDNEFRFTSAGLQKVKSLLHLNEANEKSKSSFTRKTGSSAQSRPNTLRSIPVSRKVVANSIVPNEFDVYQNSYKESLESFFRQKNPGNGNPNRIVTIAYYITKINHQEYFTEGNIDYAYRILNLGGKPAHLKQIIINLKNERIWFQKILDQSIAGWKLTRQAEIYVEEKLPIRN
ncbi:zinc ribbon domain-containing protein [Adhaeribacter pallidiroseus]|uniref:Uncharacterized protein n=1 Tax=Adhaeribacter pallidiroseus TaxID=2072847 RepID=A0A369QLJ5_9BACT|nr:zinc ribbon domain-containing protein [Adhaeribacter pallidiroseus]RDC63128.1 hypothetical protein AHMF7616_01728 [Adhaeribacter pallidiroseus]